jgi:hypothetical protein
MQLLTKTINYNKREDGMFSKSSECKKNNKYDLYIERLQIEVDFYQAAIKKANESVQNASYCSLEEKELAETEFNKSSTRTTVEKALASQSERIEILNKIINGEAISRSSHEFLLQSAVLMSDQNLACYPNIIGDPHP